MQSVVQTAAGAAAPIQSGPVPSSPRLVVAASDPAAAAAGRDRSPRSEGRLLDRAEGIAGLAPDADALPPLRLSARPLPATGHVLVTLSGRLDSSPALHLLVRGLARPGCTVLVLDLTDLTAIDEAGVGVLVALVRRAAECGRCLHLCADPDSPAAAELRAASLWDGLEISLSPSAAVAGCPCSCRCVA